MQEEARPHVQILTPEPRTLQPSPPTVLLVDAVGELGAWWGTARIAFVGGSFGNRGGQNMIEPAAYGAAVSFGPNTWNFRDVVAAMLAHDAAVVVEGPEALAGFRPPLSGRAGLCGGLGRSRGGVGRQSTRRDQRTFERLAPLVEDLAGRHGVTRHSRGSPCMSTPHAEPVR